MVKRGMRFLATVLIGLSLAGCANYFNIKVNGYTDPNVPGQITPGDSFCVMENQEAKNPLLEAEVKGKITKLLETRGYPVTTFDKADYFLFFGYGLGEPRSVSAAAPDYYGGVGWGVGYGWGGPSVVIGVPYGTYPADTASLYDRWLMINVVEAPAYRARKDTRPVWTGEARSVGTSSDLRTVLNYLLVADFKEFGKNTGKAITREIQEQDPEIYSLTH
ncbi:MAG: DUF4136 domain-containing protein [Desulfobaccales bacterium]